MTETTEKEDDFEARQRAARERVLAFEHAQAEKKKQQEAEALQAHLEGMEKKRLDTLAAVEAMNSSLNNHSSQNGGFGVSPQELMQDSDDEDNAQQPPPPPPPPPPPEEPSQQELTRAELKKQQLAALDARLQQQETDQRAKIQAIADQQKASAEERTRAREQHREQQRLEQQRLADEQINQSKAHMEELARIAREQQERLMALMSSAASTAKKTTSGTDGTPTRPQRSSTYGTTVNPNRGGQWDDDDNMSVNSRSSITDTKERTLKAFQTDMDAIHEYVHTGDDTEYQKFKAKGKRHSSYIDTQRQGGQKPDMDWQDPVAISQELRQSTSIPVTKDQNDNDDSDEESMSESHKSNKSRKSSKKMSSSSSRRSKSGRKPLRRQRSSSLSAMDRSNKRIGRSKTAEPDFDWSAFLKKNNGSSPSQKKKKSLKRNSTTVGTMSASSPGKSTRGRRNTTIGTATATPTPRRGGITRQRSSSLTDIKRGRRPSSPDNGSKDSSFRGRSKSVSAQSRSRSKSRSSRRKATTKSPTPVKSLLDNASSKKKSLSRGRLTRQRSSSLSELHVNRKDNKDARRSRSRSVSSKSTREKGKSSVKDKTKNHASSSSLGDLPDHSSRRQSRSKSGGRHRSRSVSVSRSSRRRESDSNNKSALGDIISHERSQSRSRSVRRRESDSNKDSRKSALDTNDNNKETTKEDAPKRRGITRQRSSSLSAVRTPRSRERSRSVNSRRKAKDDSSRRKSMLDMRDSATPDNDNNENHDPHSTFYDWIAHSKDAIGRLESKKAALEERRKKKKLQRNALRKLERLKRKEKKDHLADFGDEDDDNDDSDQEWDDEEPDFGEPEFDLSITGKPQGGSPEDDTEVEVDMTELGDDDEENDNLQDSSMKSGPAMEDDTEASEKYEAMTPEGVQSPTGPEMVENKVDAAAGPTGSSPSDSADVPSGTKENSNNSSGEISTDKTEETEDSTLDESSTISSKDCNKGSAGMAKQGAKQPSKRKSVVASPKSKQKSETFETGKQSVAATKKGAKSDTQSKAAESAKKQGGKETKEKGAESPGAKDSKKADAAPSSPRRKSGQSAPKKGPAVSDPPPKKGLTVSDPPPKGAKKEDAAMDDTSQHSDATSGMDSSKRRGSILGKVMKNTKALIKGKRSSDDTAKKDDSESKDEMDTSKRSEKSVNEKKKKPDLQAMDIDIKSAPASKASKKQDKKGTAALAKKLSKGAAAPAKKPSKGDQKGQGVQKKNGKSLEAMDIPFAPSKKQNGKKGTTGGKTASKGKGRGRSDASAPKRGVTRQRSQSLSDMVRGKIRDGFEPKPKKSVPRAVPSQPDATDYEVEDYSESPLRTLDTYEDELTLEQLRAKVAKLEKQLKETEEAEAREVEEVVQSARNTYGNLSKKAEQVSNLPDDLSLIDEKLRRNNEIVKYLKAENQKRRDDSQKIKTEFFDLHQNTMRLEKSTEQTLGYLEKLEDVYYQGEIDKRQRLLGGLAAHKEADETLTEELNRRTAFVDCEKRLLELYEGSIAKLLKNLGDNYDDTAFVNIMIEIAAGERDHQLVEMSEGDKKEMVFVEEGVSDGSVGGGNEKGVTAKNENPIVEEDENKETISTEEGGSDGTAVGGNGKDMTTKEEDTVVDEEE